MDRCPVCGMKVDPRNPPATSTYEGRTYNFCSQECKKEFDKNPQRFATQKVR